MLTIGLTGTIASGKSTTAAMMAETGVPVFSADATVHDLYRGAAVRPVGAAFPGVVVGGEVDRGKLAAMLEREPAEFARLESIVHPMVRQAERAFLESAAAAGQPMVVIEHPLLFELGGNERVDKVIVTTAPAAVRRKRALARPRMTPAMYRLLTARQWSDREKRRRADYVVDTSKGLDAARARIGDILAELSAESARRAGVQRPGKTNA